MKLKLTIFLLSLLFVTFHCDAQKSIGIFTYKVQGMKPWDPDSINTGINGSEEAVIYVSQKLVKLGYKVIVYGYQSKNPLYSSENANPRYVDSHFDDGSVLDIAIAWRVPDIAEKLRKRAHKVYFWPHDICCFALTNWQINCFDDVLWLTEWQRKQWIGINPGFAKFHHICGNGINPEQFKTARQRSNPHSCIYGSNYARGLDILLDIWPSVKKHVPDATLDIYYGWNHWGILPLEKERKMRAQIAKLASLDVHDHGQVGHAELNRAYERASLWTYPCTDLEVFCITALRAQLAGALPVIIEGSALKETVRHGFKCYKREDYAATLIQAMKHAETMSLEERKKMKNFILQEYTWEKVAEKWRNIFES